MEHNVYIIYILSTTVLKDGPALLQIINANSTFQIDLECKCGNTDSSLLMVNSYNYIITTGTGVFETDKKHEFKCLKCNEVNQAKQKRIE